MRYGSWPVLLCLAASGVFASTAGADAPRLAKIVDGGSMAGVALGTPAPRNADGDSVTTGELARWGSMASGFCFEGTNCAWHVAGGGRVDVILGVSTGRVDRIATDARGWRTARDIGRGSSVAMLHKAYGTRISRRDTCGLNGFGGDNRGFVYPTRRSGERRFTFFELDRSRRRVARVWVGRGRVGRAAPGC